MSTAPRDPAITVWAEARLPGFHRWPGAGGHRGYLAARHRHLFHVRAEAAVAHDDRDIEFHDLGDLVRGWWGPGPREWDCLSCEAIARDLATHLAQRGVPVTRVTVAEDGEAGATVTLLAPGEA